MQITAEDVMEMTTCSLIDRYRSYSASPDDEVARSILQYEQMLTIIMRFVDVINKRNSGIQQYKKSRVRTSQYTS